MSATTTAPATAPAPGIYYSASKRGFFNPAIHTTLPTDAVLVPQETYTALLTAQGHGQVIGPDVNGNPVASAPVMTAAGALSALAALYASKETLGVSFQASGATAASVFPSDNNAQLKLVSGFAMANAGLWTDGTPWLTIAGVGVPFAKADVIALATKVSAYVAACSTRYAALIAAVQAAPTTDTSTGWPSNS
jgi:hypothetical protein